MSVALDEWVDLLRREYLESFITSGGAAVKIAVAPPEQATEVLDAVAAAARQQGYCVARVDAAATKVHMIDQIFHAVARQVDWPGLTDRWLRDLLNNNGIFVAPEQPLQDVDALAAVNDRQRRELLQEINRLIENALVRNYALSKEFRTAIAMMCRSAVNPQNVSPTDADLIQKWLHGHKCSLTSLRRVQIHQRIGRHNARWLLNSLTLWLRQTGAAGLVLLLDLNAVVRDKSAEPALAANGAPAGEMRDNALPVNALPVNPVRYTRGALLDTYEVLRQFIDETDEMAHVLLVAVAGPGLLDDPKRNVDNYTALKLRIVDEVHDHSRSNPLNAMVRLSATGEHK